MMKKGILILLLCSVLFLFCACRRVVPRPVPAPSSDVVSTPASDVASDTGSNAGKQSIQKFSVKFGINPDNVQTSQSNDITEIYNGTVSGNQFKQYAEYLKTKGFKEDTAAEKQYKNDFELVYVFNGSVEKNNVVFSYSQGVGVVSYGPKCQFESGSGSGNSGAVPGNGGNNQPVQPTPNANQKKCSYCLGLGTCPSCYGSGRVNNPYVTDSKNLCEDCRGLGTCPKCHGSGKVN